jgi:malonyl-CoA O-methyltransferase
MMRVATQRLQRNFSDAAAHYDARAQFQHTETLRVLDAARMFFAPSARIADIGCGTGYFAAMAQASRPQWNIIGIDIAQGMSEIAATRCTAITADAACLPLADAAVDAAVSSLCYQWVENQTQAFAELARVLKSGGMAVVASLGTQSLCELRAAAQAAELPLGLLPMRGFEASKQAWRDSGFTISFAQQRLVTEHYPNVMALLDSMRGIGAGNNFKNSRRHIAPKRWAVMLRAYEAKRTAQGIPATWEHHFFVVHKPA